MNRRKYVYFEDVFPEPKVSKTLLACYLLTVIGVWAAMSTLDYREARSMECARKSNSAYIVYHDSDTDTCKKEPRNGTTKKN